MRVLVTGAAGFLGSHLVDRLLADDHDVIGLDDLSTGSIANLQPPNDRRFTFMFGDVRIPIPPDSTFPPIERIYHLACPASPVAYQKTPVKTIETSLLGTRNMLALATRMKARLLLTSTSEVYGDPEVSPQPESYWGHVNPIGVRSCFSDDTEIMTARGWCRFVDLTPQDVVATLAEDQTVHYVRPREIIKEPFEGEMIHFSNSKMDLLVTPNHRMIDERFGREFISADADVEWPHRKTPSGGIWPDRDVTDTWSLSPTPRGAKVAFSGVPIEPWLEFVGIYLAEGCVTYTAKKTTIDGKEYRNEAHRILLAHDHGWKEQKIRACLERLPWRFTELDHQFQIVNKQLAETLEPFGRKSIVKKIPREFLDLPPRLLRILFDGLMLDGAHRDGRAYYTSSPQLADAAQEIALKIGLAATIVTDTAERNPWSDRDGFRVNLRPSVKACYPVPTRVAYSGLVYCVDAPPHRTVLVRRNGKAIFSGNCYDESKRAAESLCYAFRQQYGTDVRVVRIFNTYGPRLAAGDGRVVSNFITQALKGIPLTVYGDGRQTRSLCYVSDMIAGLTMVMETDRIEPINLGNPNELTMLELAQRIIKLVGPPASTIVHEGLPADDPKRRCPDITRAQSIGWRPEVDLIEGLKRTISYFRNLEAARKAFTGVKTPLDGILT